MRKNTDFQQKSGWNRASLKVTVKQHCASFRATSRAFDIFSWLCKSPEVFSSLTELSKTSSLFCL